ncbi:hypothetical protein CRE_22512 [Caenorhabditis remanei]|uniref:RING-type domain-containing protein n=1 Tax=Caenorhabditis remanei TaxID=31234 RepID=E3MU58_CAERE|nr:hypothetical protein CRE_22512 [Caenorhabditis remanei]
MSKFLKIHDDALTPMYIHKEAMRYMLEECRGDLSAFNKYPQGSSKGKEEYIVKALMDRAGNNLRMYGTAREFAENLKIYGNFTGSHVFFGAIDEPYQTSPIIYRSLNNQEYIYKSDLLVILHNIINQINPNFPFEAVSIIAFSLKSLEEKVTDNMEFVRFDQEILEEIEKELREEIDKNTMRRPETDNLIKEMSGMTFEKCLEKVKSVAPEGVWGDQGQMRDHRIRTVFTTTCKEFPRGMHHLPMSVIYFACDPVIKAIGNVRRNHLGFLRLRDKNSAVTVRLFEDEHGERFVMKDELDDTLYTIGEEEIHVILTMSQEEVYQKLGHQNVEFILHPIRRAKHRAVPIRGPGASGPNNFFILAIDAFFELSKSVITGCKFFQNHDFQRFAMIMEEVDSILKPHCEKPYFIIIQAIDVIKKTLFICDFFFKKNVALKEIRNAKSDGFTVHNLKNELKHLGLTETFPEIQEHAEAVYEGIDNVKKEKFLRTCDLFDAVESCQMICILNRIPNLKKFVHNQKGCGRIAGLKCEKCEKTSEIQNSMKNLKIESSGCHICSTHIKASDVVTRCPLCKTRFHSNCALKWIKDQKHCPACKGDFPGI